MEARIQQNFTIQLYLQFRIPTFHSNFTCVQNQTIALQGTEKAFVQF